MASSVVPAMPNANSTSTHHWIPNSNRTGHVASAPNTTVSRALPRQQAKQNAKTVDANGNHGGVERSLWDGMGRGAARTRSEEETRTDETGPLQNTRARAQEDLDFPARDSPMTLRRPGSRLP